MLRIKKLNKPVVEEPAVVLGGGSAVVPVEAVKPQVKAPSGNLPADNLLPQGQAPLAPAPTPAPTAAPTAAPSKYNIRSRLNQLRMPGRRQR